MRKIFIAILCIGIFTTGCKQLLMWKYGITKPKLETPESISKFAKKYNLDPMSLFIFKDSASYISCFKDTVFNKNMLSSIFFNKNDFFIEYRRNGQCQWSGGAFLQNYSQDSIYSIDSTFHISKFINKIIPLYPTKQSQNYNDTELTIVIIWAKFIGKYNERLFGVLDYVKNSQNIKTRIILLNIDVLEGWNLSKEQMPK
jgi:hypothetical protein